MDAQTEIMPGAEPYSAAGDRRGALVLHGYTGCPQSMRPLAMAFAEAGFTVELPRLPGHGTTVEDMANYRWSNWTATVESTYQDLKSRTDSIVVAGLSMGGALTLWLAQKHPEIKGIVLINTVAESDDFGPLVEAAEGLAAQGQEFMPGVAGDVADPNSKELGYTSLPTRTVKPLVDGVAAIKARLGEIRMPALVMRSTQDHVVPASSAELLRSKLGGPVEYMELENSYHVATIDKDGALINRESVAFGERVTGEARRAA